MADRETERLILGQDVPLSAGEICRLSLVVDHDVVDPARAEARGIGLRDGLLRDLWDLLRASLDQAALHGLATEEDARSAACDRLGGPVREVLERHGSALVDLSFVVELASRSDPLAAIGRARAADAERAASLMAMGVVTHTRFDAAGEAAT